MTPTHYHLGKFPPADLDWANLIPAIGQAHAALAAFVATLETVPNPQVLIAPLRGQEAVYSNRIEGTQTTLAEVLTFEAEDDSDFGHEKINDLREVIQYRRALMQATRELKDRPLSRNLIKDTHRTLMEGVRGQDKDPGEFRRIPESVWIGPPGSNIENARFIPCPVEHLPNALDAFERYIHSNEVPDKLVQLAIVHAEFEAIHPFLDGNGRLGRLIVPLFMVAKDLIKSPHFYISGSLNRNRDEYYDRLLAVSRDGDWDGWVEFFLNAVEEQAHSNMQIARNIFALYDVLKRRVEDETHSPYGTRALDWIFEKPIFRSTDFVNNSDIPKPTAYRILKVLRDSEMLEVLRRSRGRRPALLGFRQLLRVAEGAE